MAEFFARSTDDHRAFIAKQPVFFVATAARRTRGSTSVPRAMTRSGSSTTRTVAYLDLGGSGNETQAHLTADGRITIMFCAFDNPALILRLYGRGVAVLPQDEGFDELADAVSAARRGASDLRDPRSRACRPVAAGACRG